MNNYIISMFIDDELNLPVLLGVVLFDHSRHPFDCHNNATGKVWLQRGFLFLRHRHRDSPHRRRPGADYGRFTTYCLIIPLP